MEREEKDFLLDGMTWSFSRVNSYETCPRMWKMEYLDCNEKSGNAFAEWGSLCHSLFERFYKGELECYMLADAYKDEYVQAVPDNFPSKRMGESYYENGLELFETFEGQYQEYEIVGVEQRVSMELCGQKFIGFIDLLLRKDGEYYIVDFKSKSKFKSKEEKQHYALQLYLYAEYVRRQYGKYPVRMEFNMFRARMLEPVVFNADDMQAAKEWFENTIQRIYDDDSYDPKPDNFFCQYLCSVSEFCPHGKQTEKVVNANVGRKRSDRKSKRKTR